MSVHYTRSDNVSIATVIGCCEVRRAYNLSCRQCEFRENCSNDKELLKFLNENLEKYEKRKPWNG